MHDADVESLIGLTLALEESSLGLVQDVMERVVLMLGC
jgi:hypothetical protein